MEQLKVILWNKEIGRLAWNSTNMITPLYKLMFIGSRGIVALEYKHAHPS